MAKDIPASDLPWTGERYVPQIGGEIELEHRHRYYWAAQFAGGKRVLDIACGEGYGSEILSRCAAHVIGVDLSEEAVVHASRKYRRSNLEFLVGSCDRIPAPDRSVDLVVSFETIEHHDRHQEMMREIKRILCPDGILIISSPDKYVYSDIPGYKNSFHVKELYAIEFQGLLKEHFANVDIFGQRVAYGSIIAAEGMAGFVSFDSEQKSPPAVRGIERATYDLAMASDGILPEGLSSIYEKNPAKSETYQELERAHAEEKRREVEAARAEAKREIEAARAEAEREVEAARAEANTRVEACNSKLMELTRAATAREVGLVAEVARLGESEGRLKREIQQQSVCSAKSIREREAEIERLKVTRFEVKRECHRIKTSLSWRFTWPLRVARNAGMASLYRAEHRIRLFSGHQLSPVTSNGNTPSAKGPVPSVETSEGLLPPSNLEQDSPHDRARKDQATAAQQLLELPFVEGLSSLDQHKETVLLVSHEISRTGAPILVLNIARALRQKYNVIVLTLGDGALRNEFLAASNLMVGPLSLEQRTPHFLKEFFREIATVAPLKFAIVNSIVSSPTLGALWENDIAIVHLIHEFSSYTRPRGQFRSSALFSGERVFPAEIVREAARGETPDETAKPGLVMPQGICIVPPSISAEARANEREQIRSDLRPEGWPKDTVVILGAGFVHLRKGVDLFITCAKRVSEMMPRRRFRFVWIGDGFEPEYDVAYSVYLEDQIDRSNLGETFAILKAVTDIESAYLESDILFLSSRLDPLPLVSMDSLYHGRPVVCFESTTGIAEYLARDPLASFGVVPLLDVESAAGRILRLIEDDEFRLQVGEASRRLAKSEFCLERYVGALDTIGRTCAARKELERADHQVISRSNLFDIGFFKCPLTPDSPHDPIRTYVSAYSSGVRPRKALPGFHPGIYAEHNDTKGHDPLAHYLSRGRPQGPWTFEVIHPGEAFRAERSLRVGLHVHLYYPEMADELMERVRGIRSEMDLLISVTDTGAAEAARTSFRSYSKGKVDVRVFNNRGRDIGPFLTGFGEAIVKSCDVIGHIHTKQSTDPGSKLEPMAQAWRRFLYANLLADKDTMADTIIERFAADDSIGLVFPDDPHIIGWGENLPCALKLGERLGIAASLPKTTFNFPVGTMFWARTAALMPLLELDFAWSDYPDEPLSYDGSLLHTIERMLPFVVEKSGFRNVVTYAPGITR